jgi:hypothetical protein
METPKSRASCDTCLSAKIECSQTKPACLRCASMHGQVCVYNRYRRIGCPTKQPCIIQWPQVKRYVAAGRIPILPASEFCSIIIRKQALTIPIILSIPSPKPFSFNATMPSINTTNQSSIRSLANQISELSTQISTYFHTSSQPEPDFTISSADVPNTPEYDALRAELNDAALDLLRLINGPLATLRTLILSHHDLAALQVALERRFFDHVPFVCGAGLGGRERHHEACNGVRSGNNRDCRKSRYG